jgi:hypothetical protein
VFERQQLQCLTETLNEVFDRNVVANNDHK